MKKNLFFNIVLMLFTMSVFAHNLKTDELFKIYSIKADGPVISVTQGTNDVASGIGEIGIGITTPNGVSFTISNTGNQVLNINSIVSSGTHASEFVVSAVPATVAAGSTASFTVTYTSGGGGLREATITINSNAANMAVFNFKINTKTHPVLTWATPADINYGVKLSATQLNASVGGGIAGVFTYSPALDTKLQTGNKLELSVSFKPENLNSYSVATKKVYINVLQLTPTITWANPADIVYGTILTGTQLNATAFDGTTEISGTSVYTPAPGTLLNVGATQNLSVEFTPSDANYKKATATAKINVTKATPVITWNKPNDISYGTLLTVAQLNATASVPGTFVYTPALATFLEMGVNQNLKVDFTPTDAANYNTQTKTVQISVVTATEPKLQAHRLLLQVKPGYNFDMIWGNKFTINWTRGEGTSCAVFVKQGIDGIAAPVSGTSYTPNTVFKQGTQLGTSGWYCVYDGTGTAVTVTGLTINTEYNVMVLEYNLIKTFKSYMLTESIYNPRVFKTLQSLENTLVASNFISRNGDGKNDVWNVERVEELLEYELSIYNNIGERVYNVTGYKNDWKATYEGTDLPVGTYYYIFKKDDSVIKGFITVVK